MAAGEYVVHLDPDDTVTPNIYQEVYNRACDSKSDLVLFNVKQIDAEKNEWIETNNVLDPITNISGIQILNNIFKFHSQNWIWHVAWNKLIRKNIVTELITLFNVNFHLVMYEDLLWSTAICLIIGQQNKCSSVDTFGLKYLRHDEAITKRNDEKTNEKKLNDVCIIYDEIERLLKLYDCFHEFKTYFRSTMAFLAKNHINGATNNYKINNNLNFDKINKLISNYYVAPEKKVFNTESINKAVTDISNRVYNDNIKELMIYGTGELAFKLKSVFERRNVHVKNFIVTNKIHEGNIQGIPVFDIKKAVNIDCSTIVIASIGSASIIKKIILDHSKSSKFKFETYSCINE